MTTVRKALIFSGAAALASSLFWMFTGMGLWAPIRPGDFVDFLRGVAILGTHVIALFGGAFAIVESE